MNFDELTGKIVTLRMKPALMRDWVVVRQTEKCLVVTKDYRAQGHPDWKPVFQYIPKKQIQEVVKSEKWQKKMI